MLHREKHQLIMGRLLQDIYSDTSLAPLLGLKGGTCAYLFYDLQRFSVDLDFDVLTSDLPKRSLIFEKIKKILENYGEIKESYQKHFTLFFLLSYGPADHNIKIEISVRNNILDIPQYYVLKEYLGISMYVATQPYLFAGKLAALTLRRKTAMRDVYDIWYFAKNNWDIATEIVKIITEKSVKEQIKDCITLIEKVKDNEILQGLGELIDDAQKTWLKKHLRAEILLLLKNYMSVLK